MLARYDVKGGSKIISNINSIKSTITIKIVTLTINLTGFGVPSPSIGVCSKHCSKPAPAHPAHTAPAAIPQPCKVYRYRQKKGRGVNHAAAYSLLTSVVPLVNRSASDLPAYAQHHMFRFRTDDTRALARHVVIGKTVSLAADTMVMPELRIVVRWRRRIPCGGRSAPHGSVFHDMTVQGGGDLRFQCQFNGNHSTVGFASQRTGQHAFGFQHVLGARFAWHRVHGAAKHAITLVDFMEHDGIIRRDLTDKTARIVVHIYDQWLGAVQIPHVVNICIEISGVDTAGIEAALAWRQDTARLHCVYQKLFRHFFLVSRKDAVARFGNTDLLVEIMTVAIYVHQQRETELVHLGRVHVQVVVERELVPVKIDIDVRIIMVIQIRTGETSLMINILINLDEQRRAHRNKDTARIHLRQLQVLGLRQGEKVIAEVLAVFRQMTWCIIVTQQHWQDRAVRLEVGEVVLVVRITANHGHIDLIISPFTIGIVFQIDRDETRDYRIVGIGATVVAIVATIITSATIITGAAVAVVDRINGQLGAGRYCTDTVGISDADAKYHTVVAALHRCDIIAGRGRAWDQVGIAVPLIRKGTVAGNAGLEVGALACSHCNSGWLCRELRCRAGISRTVHFELVQRVAVWRGADKALQPHITGRDRRERNLFHAALAAGDVLDWHPGIFIVRYLDFILAAIGVFPLQSHLRDQGRRVQINRHPCLVVERRRPAAVAADDTVNRQVGGGALRIFNRAGKGALAECQIAAQYHIAAIAGAVTGTAAIIATGVDTLRYAHG